MKKLLLASAMIIGLFANQSVMAENQYDVTVTLTCLPKALPQAHGDLNPVDHINVGIQYNNTHWSPGDPFNMYVIHIHFNGNKSDRSQQYTNILMRQTEPNTWQWGGQLKSNLNIVMVGTLHHNPDNNSWVYWEVINKRNGAPAYDELVTTAPCMPD